MSLPILIAVAGGGFGGAILRGWVQWKFQSHPSAATLFVNCIGSGLFGVFLQIPQGSPLLSLFVLTGFCGSLTTFSTWILESIRIYFQISPWRALAHSALTLAASLASLGVGSLVGNWIFT